MYGPNQPDLAVKMSMARIKDVAASSLEPLARLINKELQVKGTSDSAGYLPRLATVKVFFLIPVLSELVYVCL